MILQSKKASKKAPPGNMLESTGQKSKQEVATREYA